MKSGGIWHLVVRKVDGTTEGKLENWKINFLVLGKQVILIYFSLYRIIGLPWTASKAL